MDLFLQDLFIKVLNMSIMGSCVILFIIITRLLSPLAFGESNTKSRIKNVLNYRKPAFWLVTVAVVACITVGIACVANPKINTGLEDTWAQDIYHYRTQYVGDNTSVSMITYKLHTPETLTHKGIQLYTDQPPYTAEVKYSATSEIREYFSSDQNQTFFDQSAIIMFALIGNVENVRFIINDGQQDTVVQRTRDWADKVMGQSVWNDSATFRKFTSLSNNIMGNLVMNLAMSSVADISALLNSGKRTNIESVQDVPNAENPTKIEINGETYYVYEKGSKYFSERPYQFINEITEETYKKILGRSPETNAYDSILSDLTAIPKKYSVENAVKDGCFVKLHGQIKSDIKIMDRFISDSKNGKKAFITTVEYTDEGDPIITKVLYDGAAYLSRDAFGGNYENYLIFQYKYLKVFEESSGEFALLLNDDSVTAEKYWKSMLSSNPKDSIENYFLYSDR